MNERGMRILAVLDTVADRLKTTQTAVAIAWLRDRPAIAAPIASATSLTQLQDLLDGMRLELDGQSIAELDAVSTP
jgi:aryl-alcohol dehydrogenase-like predicted oxidoreductase